MSLLRLLPLVILLDVAPGFCCGGGHHRYDLRDRSSDLEVINHSAIEICRFEWSREGEPGPAHALFLPRMSEPGGEPAPAPSAGSSTTPTDPPLEAWGSRRWPIPADEITLRLLDCQGRQLLVQTVKRSVNAYEPTRVVYDPAK